MISNCGHDENGRYAGGRAGDQTGTEYQLRSWYNRPWDVVIRCTDPSVRKLIALLATQAAENNRIGYDQGTKGNSQDRYSFWGELVAAKYHPENITNPCETDCSNSTLSIVKAVGYRLGINALQKVSIYGYTGNLEKILLNTGLFKSLRDKKYLTSDVNLFAGDILLCTGHHVCINVTGDEVVENATWYESKVAVGKDGLVVTAKELNLRKGPGTSFPVCGTAVKGSILYATEKTWCNKKLWFRCSAGWFSGNYVEGWIQEENGKWWHIEDGGKYPASTIKTIVGRDYVFDKNGWMITADRIAPDGHIME